MFTLNTSACRIVLLAALALAAAPLGCSASAEESLDDDATDQAELTSSASARFETFAGADGQIYFDLVAANGKNVLHSEGYVSQSNANRGIQSLIDNAAAESAYHVEEADNGDYYFNVVARNGEIVSSSEMYATKSSAERGAKSARTLVQHITHPAPVAAPHQQRFELFKSGSSNYFRLRAGNGEIVLASQGYSSKAAARTGIASVLENGVVTERFDRIEGADGKVRIRLVANNGAVIATGEPYASRSNAERAITRISEILADDVPTVEN
jgi:uncharacterized protein YegP (UPF0339 family)